MRGEENTRKKERRRAAVAWPGQTQRTTQASAPATVYPQARTGNSTHALALARTPIPVPLPANAVPPSVHLEYHLSSLTLFALYQRLQGLHCCDTERPKGDAGATTTPSATTDTTTPFPPNTHVGHLQILRQQQTSPAAVSESAFCERREITASSSLSQRSPACNAHLRCCRSISTQADCRLSPSHAPQLRYGPLSARRLVHIVIAPVGFGVIRNTVSLSIALKSPQP